MRETSATIFKKGPTDSRYVYKSMEQNTRIKGTNQNFDFSDIGKLVWIMQLIS